MRAPEILTMLLEEKRAQAIADQLAPERMIDFIGELQDLINRFNLEAVKLEDKYRAEGIENGGNVVPFRRRHG